MPKNNIRDKAFSNISHLLDNHPYENYEKKIMKKITAPNKHVKYSRPHYLKSSDKMLPVIANFLISLRDKGTKDVIYKSFYRRMNINSMRPFIMYNPSLFGHIKFHFGPDVINFIIFRMLLSLKFIKVLKIQKVPNERKKINIKLTKIGLEFVNDTFSKNKLIPKRKSLDVTIKKKKDVSGHLFLMASSYTFSAMFLILFPLALSNFFDSLILLGISLFCLIVGIIFNKIYLKCKKINNKEEQEEYKKRNTFNKKARNLLKNATRNNFLNFLKKHHIEEPNENFGYNKHARPIDSFMFN